MESTYIEAVANNTSHGKKIGGPAIYGTAGFRMNAGDMDHIVYRMGILAALRSKVLNGNYTGIMITASHNPEPDNGVKLIEANGQMLESSWEIIATNLANAEDCDLPKILQDIITENNIDMSVEAKVLVGRDTRESGRALSIAAIDGITIVGGKATDYEVVTTPQLHFFVVCLNNNEGDCKATKQGYNEKLSKAFKALRANQINRGNYTAELYVDAANGVGGLALQQLQVCLSDQINLHIYNNGTGNLNERCGADYVKTKQEPPICYSGAPNCRSCSFDGDADRVVFYYTDDMGKFHLLDGDRIATLVATYFKELLEASQLNLEPGIVQTAYSNGESTNYILNVLKVPVECVSTGVKHLHQKALQFDIGIYFEANGHGTVLFKESAMNVIREAATDDTRSASEKEAALKLSTVIDLINQTVGDAISDMLLVETILHAKGWNGADWERTYTDLPNIQVKVKVQDKSVVTTTDVDRRCVTPVGLQDEINKVVARYPKGRSFVRASGTEDIVRVYAECEDPDDLNRMASEISLLVYRMAGGVGPEPML